MVFLPSDVVWLVAIAVSSWGLTGLMRRYALRTNLVDRPNERSSHTIPTPRGGGVAITAAFAAGLGLMESSLPTGVVVGLLVGGMGVAVLGFVDDHGHVAPIWRLIGHFCCAAWVLAYIGVPELEYVPTRSVGGLLAVLYLIWMINLYNFMDGIDGIAAIEAVTAGIGGALVVAVSGVWSPAGFLPLLLAAAAAGFLIWNFPPARIFMGDAGSGFLGLMVGAISLSAAQVRPTLFWAWGVLLGVFVVDATMTLLRRVLRREPIFNAHRSHAYQHATQRYRSHRAVSLAVAGINLFWLLPWALAIAAGWISGIPGLLAAYTPLVLLAIRHRAGCP